MARAIRGVRRRSLRAIAVAAFLCRGAAAGDATGTSAKVSISDWHVRLSVAPLRVSLRNGDELWLASLLPVALGVRAPNGFWAECGASSLAGRDGSGWDVSLLTGMTLGEVQPKRGEWTTGFPIFIGYRYARRPNSSPADGHAYLETMNMGVFGARASNTRWAAGGNGFEFAFEGLFAVPFTRDEPVAGSYYRDAPTRFSIEVSVILGWLIGL